MSIKELEFNSDVDNVVGIQFSLFSPEEIKEKVLLKLLHMKRMMVIFKNWSLFDPEWVY